MDRGEDLESHRENLRKNCVILDIAERRELIRKGAQAAAEGVGGKSSQTMSFWTR